MTDLRTRLLVAVWQRMDVARAAILDESPNWHADKPVGPLDGAVNNGKRRLVGGWQRAVEHAAANDPATVLRHCEAVLELLRTYDEAAAFYDRPENRHHSAGEVHGLGTAIKLIAAAYGIEVDG